MPQVFMQKVVNSSVPSVKLDHCPKPDGQTDLLAVDIVTKVASNYKQTVLGGWTFAMAASMFFINKAAVSEH